MTSAVAALFVAFVFSLLIGVTALGLWQWLHPTYHILIEAKNLVSC
jgi:hypothetical protein